MKPLVPALFFAAFGATSLLHAQESEALSPPKAEVVEEPGADPAEPDAAAPAEPAMEEEAAQPDPGAEPDPLTEPEPEAAPRRGMAGEVPETRKAEVVPDPAADAAEKEKEKQKEKEDADKPENAKEVRAVPADPRNTAPPVIREVKSDKPRIAMAMRTDPNAKPLSLRVPGPRGLIVDRHGKPFAQERIAHYIGVQLPLREGMKDAEVLEFARAPLAFCQSQLPGGWAVSDAEIVLHYKQRRWVPLMSASLVPEEKADKLKNKVPDGVVLRPIFLRTYPEGKLAGHLIGQMGKTSGFAPAKNALEAEEPMWPATVGRGGLEKQFDAQLTGKPGLYTALYDAKGEKLTEEWQERPHAGHTVVTTLDMEMQQICEKNLRERGVRGAFVIMDIKTGDVIAMASLPCVDPNEWVYGISEKRSAEFLNNKDKPLYCRALAGRYPPASTFKIITALAALETNQIDPDTEFQCPPSLKIDGQWFNNHTKRHEGPMNVVGAIMKSCNTWFYQASKICGGGALSTMASRFGFGEKTGICLPEMEIAGNMPTPESYAKKNSAMTGGYLAITGIGQGEVIATPLQVCQMMAGVARGDSVVRPRLVKMIQDVDGKIVQHFPTTLRNSLSFEKENLEAVRRGMYMVVHGGGGTGSRAENQYVTIVGKTGTGEWGSKKDLYVAWFAGYLPYKNPEYAYACLYEGDRGEGISGGKMVAPIVGDVFNEIYRLKNRRGDNEKRGKDDEAGSEEGDGDETQVSTPRRRRTPKESSSESSSNSPAPAPAPVAAPEQPKKGLRWLFRRRTPLPAPAPPARFGR